ncbi:hypothetical protein [Hymenobacter convexus]|uniref:hypothetical protein n=1 Tax=Hymenobacter sp. CA1UV-4 TaxID=3063782 RepID=UPI002713F60A|nr:hypothetical protein [Hymenobacter sp. CA1UV-4]MDO7853592.1 hypothetical protein [Hymenobacter sp. CA1UV-4]
MSLPKSILYVAVATALLLLVPLVAMRFSPEVNWTGFDFLVAGGLLFGAGVTFVLIAQKANTPAYRLAVAVAVVAGLLLVWANLAVGLVGSENNPVNALYLAVLAVAFVGAFVARFRPLGMSNAMFAAALTYVVVTAVALFIWKPAGAAVEPWVGSVNVLGANAVFAAMWAAAGLLFRRASAGGAPQHRHLA